MIQVISKFYKMLNIFVHLKQKDLNTVHNTCTNSNIESFSVSLTPKCAYTRTVTACRAVSVGVRIKIPEGFAHTDTRVRY